MRGYGASPISTATHGIDRTAAAAVTSTLFIGWGVGAPLFGWFSDRIGRRRLPFIIGVVICTRPRWHLSSYLPGLPLWAISVLCFLCGFGGSSQIVGFAAVREHNAASLSGTAIGFVNGMVTGAGALYQPLLGWLLDLAWGGQMVAGARIYDPSAYRFAFSVIVAGAVIGLFCTLAMRETYCRQASHVICAIGRSDRS